MVCTRCILMFLQSSPEEIELLKNAGLAIEAILENEALNEKGEYEDIVRMSVLNQ